MPSASSSPEVLARTPSLVVRRKRSSIVVVVPAITPATDPGGAPTAWPMRRPSVRASSPAQPRLSESAASVAAPSSSKTGGLFTRVLRKWFGGGSPLAASGPSARPRSGSWSLRTSVGSKRGSIEERAHAAGNPPPLSKLGRAPATGNDAEAIADGDAADSTALAAATPAPPTIPAEDAVLLVRSLPDLARQHALLARAMPAPTASPLRALSLSVPLPPSTRSSTSFRNGSSVTDGPTLDGDDDDTTQWGLSPAAAIWAVLGRRARVSGPTGSTATATPFATC
ncbi:hypothetical protein AMAG_18114 [Allomyces macrogynus ATCC 38327]|uniref:Uncharacterized protein n=1 Tax=Allomyces macrogynus (strain ATCC 38327) TaxID=578462 RepID=A0A0L0S975_ALLM3|nr:hypothetical protein AMAG_18114 [Allomyces macrogynus ATCC 38327]|eukprot:KNE59158.1 hypothetical protein AMAG_18114 [Allomyces macrogynus ATCC 38327]